MEQTRLELRANAVGIVKESMRRKFLSKKHHKSIPEKVTSLEAAVQYLMDQDQKKRREIDVLKEKMKHH